MALQTINIGASPNDGSGDPLRTAMDKINDNFLAVSGNVFNVKDPAYGAVGDGVTDNYAAIQAAIDAMSDYDTLYIPAGAFAVSQKLVSDTARYIKVRCDGWIEPHGSYSDFLIQFMRVGSKYSNVLSHRGLRLDHRLRFGLSSARPSPILSVTRDGKDEGEDDGLETSAGVYHGDCRSGTAPAQ
jgi:hypothetical protein